MRLMQYITIPAAGPADRLLPPSRFRPLLAGLALAGLLYVLLPLLGIQWFAHALGLKQMVILAGLVMAAAAYFVYLGMVIRRPHWLVAFILIAWCPVAAINNGLLNQGVNIHLRPLLLLSVGLPALWISLPRIPALLRKIPYLKYYSLFFLWVVLYFLLYNAQAVDPAFAGESVWSEGSVGVIQLFSYFYGLLAIMITAVLMLGGGRAHRHFDRLNRGLILLVIIQSMAAIIGYPLGWFSTMVDGFVRTTGFFSHPNPFAHHMGLLLVYMLGLFCYYQGNNRSRMSRWLLAFAIGAGFTAFLMGLSKTALGVFTLCVAILFLLNLRSPANLRFMVPVIVGIIILLPIGLWAFEAITGNNFLSLLEARMIKVQSFLWRMEMWEDLTAGMNGWWLFTGHGFTAANMTMFHLSFDDAANARPLMMVHNGYIALLYDLGVTGYLLFAAVLSVLFQALRFWLGSARPSMHPLDATLAAMAIYFLIVSAFDEMTYMFNAPLLFWTLATCLYCLRLQQGPERET